MVRNNFAMLPGSGVNLEYYSLCDNHSRMRLIFSLSEGGNELKGINQYLKCAKVIKEKYSSTNFYISSFIEEDKYKEIIGEYYDKGIINNIGFQKDIKS